MNTAIPFKLQPVPAQNIMKNTSAFRFFFTDSYFPKYFFLLFFSFLIAANVQAQTTTKPAVKAKQSTAKSVKKPAAKPVKKATPGKTTTANVTPEAKPAAPATLIWRTPALQEGLGFYMSLNYAKAEAKFREAAAQGDKDAYYFLGRMHQYRELKYNAVKIDTLKDIQDATQYFAANTDSARFYFDRAISENSLLGHLGLAELMILQTQADKQNFLQRMRTAAIEIREKAVQGDAFANRLLGSMYYTGYGEMKDLGLAFNYLNRAAEKGDVVAYCQLANLYLEGEGVKPSMDKAVYWLKKGVVAGDRESLYTLGLLYEEGNLGEIKLPEARKLYRQAVSKGSINAFEQLKYINQTTDQKLVIAAVTRNPEMIKRALNAGADVNTLAEPDDFGDNLDGRTPLMHTIFIPLLLEDYGVIYEPEVRLQGASILLRKGAEVNARDRSGKTALHHVVGSSRVKTELFELEQIQLIDTLMHYNADLNIQDNEGNTALAQGLKATIGQHVGIMEVQKLIQAGANPNLVNKAGKSPLMLACEMDADFEIILALVQAGADVKMVDQNSRAAIDFTKKENVRNMLLAAGSPAPKQ
ncbi:ankryin [Pontibacter arcticus]|uniref:Ankryin n=2 Tax=Pontibacter arcticus TaxID=2080288 RepID=A0A364RCM9_9BACT|nr:ankryin [Pontibacter arcticus]